MNQCFNRECGHNNKSISGCSRFGGLAHSMCLKFAHTDMTEILELREENENLKEENERLKKLLEQSKRVNKAWKNFLSK